MVRGIAALELRADAVGADRMGADGMRAVEMAEFVNDGALLREDQQQPERQRFEHGTHGRAMGRCRCIWER